jgi:hypothetical protein
VATGKVATQSSTFKDNNVKFGPSNAVDGNNSTFSHTNDASSIWEVDLAGDYGISYTSIHRIDGAEVLLTTQTASAG